MLKEFFLCIEVKAVKYYFFPSIRNVNHNKTLTSYCTEIYTSHFVKTMVNYMVPLLADCFQDPIAFSSLAHTLYGDCR